MEPPTYYYHTTTIVSIYSTYLLRVQLHVVVVSLPTIVSIPAVDPSKRSLFGAWGELPAYRR
eukprot:scaffold9074_cov141-Amphora_coffeaeformis.AAC.4